MVDFLSLIAMEEGMEEGSEEQWSGTVERM